MVERIFFDSVYKYTDPPRYFKANDPYFYRVDNIPLKQIQENCNFLKSQLEGLLGASGSIREVDRSEFSELKPYVDGTNNKVKVKPGKFTARVNDAYTVTPLQFLTQVLGYNLAEINTWESRTNIDLTLNNALNTFKSTLAADAMNMNGLVERTFTFAMQSADRPSQYLTSGQPGYLPSPLTPAYPNWSGRLWRSNTNESTDVVTQYELGNPSLGFFTLGNAEADFIKRWRGIARTSLVSVENELEVDIPAFDENDFFYIDETGTRRLLDANQRIDLVFIYTKSIDTSAAMISKFSNNTPTRITQPVLGIVKGAGLGVNLKRPQGGNATNDAGILTTTPDGTPLMLASVADENGDNIGIGSIKGSFPSPDDLMNISPLICENLEQNNYALIGQTVLPVAYVVVRKTASLNQNSVNIIEVDDLIDIRPFFRTTELSYNERAGLAAATPQVSLANPVVTEAVLDNAVRKIYDDYSARLNQIQSPNATPLQPRIVGAGYVRGGYWFGVEAVLADYVRRKYGISSEQQIKSEVLQRYGYPTGTVPHDLPDWDVAEWCARGNFNEKGIYPNDRINFHLFGPGFNGAAEVDFAAYQDRNRSSRIASLGTDRIHGSQSNTDKGNSCIYFVKKRIQIDRSQIEWAADYHVNAQLWNCAPLSCRTHKDGNNLAVASNASVWIDKKPTEFTIFVSWVAADQYNGSISAGASEPGDINVRPYMARNEGSRFAGFSVINNDIATHDYSHRTIDGESSAGVAIYPTLYFQIYGIPSGFLGNQADLQAQVPVMSLR
jgi:hypothetical protein